MNAATLIGSLLGQALGAVLIAGVILLAFRVFGWTSPSFRSTWQAAFAVSIFVSVALWGIESFLPDGSIYLILPVMVVGGFVIYDRMLTTPEGERMGRGSAGLALGTNFAFSAAMVFLVAPILLGLMA